METNWWKNSVVYQIYPKSFQDTDGDGVGDLNGITLKMDYIASLGVDIVWICPVCQSPMYDNGYDISDYYKIDPVFGTNEDMYRLIAEAGKRHIKILLDLVVNHCSDVHPWFQKAKKDPDCEEAGSFYFFRTDDGKEPNNWRSNFGGSVWSQLPDGRWYYHTFSPKQPDLNWENPKLRKEVYKIIEWWLQKGVAGFRIDAITFIKKDLSFQSRTPAEGNRYPVENFTDYNGIDAFLQEMRTQVFSKYNCLTVAEAPGVDKRSFRKYCGENGFFSMIFDFSWDNMQEETDKSSESAVERWKAKIFSSQLFASKNGWPAIALENHDQSRCINRFLERKDRNFFSASALATIYFFLYGTPFIYQGQEIGMANAVWNDIDEINDVRSKRMLKEAIELQKDPEKVLNWINESGRDNSRTPMQWNAGFNAGFSTGVPWLKVQENHDTVNVECEERAPLSLLSYYKKLIALRRHPRYGKTFADGSFHPLMEERIGIIAYRRGTSNLSVEVIVNFTNQQKKVGLPSGTCLLSNYQKSSVTDRTLLLQPYQAMIFVETQNGRDKTESRGSGAVSGGFSRD